MNFFIRNFYDYIFIIVAKRPIERQLRRLRKQDPSSGLQSEASLKLDLYFQHYSSQRMHSSLENVLKQILSDIRVLGGPPPLPSAATSSTSSSLVAGTGLFNFTIFFCNSISN